MRRCSATAAFTFSYPLLAPRTPRTSYWAAGTDRCGTRRLTEEGDYLPGLTPYLRSDARSCRKPCVMPASLPLMKPGLMHGPHHPGLP
jgi:hypothetical protein